MGFNLAGGYFHCWRCGRLPFTATVARLLKSYVGEAKVHSAIAQHQTGSAAPKRTAKTRTTEVIYPPGIGSLLKPHRDYLRGRHFDPDVLQRDWGLMGVDHRGGVWSWRIIIPVHDAHGNLVTYQGRAIGDAQAKYRTLDDDKAAASIKTLLYGEHLLPNQDAVVVCEGVTDVWRLGVGAVATFGIAWTVEQAARLTKFKHRVIMFDPEPKAQKKARQIAGWLAPYDGTTEIVEKLDSDPGDLPAATSGKLMRKLGFPVPARL